LSFHPSSEAEAAGCQRNDARNRRRGIAHRPHVALERAHTVAYPEHVSDKRASSLGEFIRGQRELSEVSVRQFAELVGISNPYLSQIERGLRTPSEQVLQSIADALQVSADTLYDQAGVPREKDGPAKVVLAIREDTKLTGRQRQALIEVYEAFVGVGARPRRS
jgi:transcriptional regulator with XRE-family HTH domain